MQAGTIRVTIAVRYKSEKSSPLVPRVESRRDQRQSIERLDGIGARWDWA
jgi:hypothetical protein